MAFLETPTAELRQGDICFAWQYPKWSLNEYLIAAPAAGGRPRSALLQVLKSGDRFPVAVCSHDCEIENGRTRVGLLIAPVFPLTSNYDENQLMDIAASSHPADDEYSYINWFPVQLAAEENKLELQVVELSAITYMAEPRKSAAALLAAKRYEMADETRQAFKDKIAAFFGRP